MARQELNILDDVDLFSQVVNALTDKALIYLSAPLPREELRGLIQNILVDYSLLQDGTFELSDFLNEKEGDDEAAY